MVYEVNKGIGGSVEFKGLKSRYFFIFIGGLVVVFILTVFLNVIGFSPLTVALFAFISGIAVVWGTFTLNKAYGEHGLMKKRANAMHPDYLISRLPIRFILYNNKVRFHRGKKIGL